MARAYGNPSSLTRKLVEQAGCSAPALATVRQSSVFRTDLDYETAPCHEAKFSPDRTVADAAPLGSHVHVPRDPIRYCRSGSPRLPMVKPPLLFKPFSFGKSRNRYGLFGMWTMLPGGNDSQR